MPAIAGAGPASAKREAGVELFGLRICSASFLLRFQRLAVCWGIIPFTIECAQELKREVTMRTPLKDRVQSPGYALLLTPNDDEEERAQVRRARAAALRRKSGIGGDILAAFSSVAAPEESSVLSREHILELHNNCIKLAAENVCNPW